MAALFYLHFVQVWNRLRTRVRRLRQPKYLAGALVGGLYLFFYFSQFLIRPHGLGGPHSTAAAPADWGALVEPLGSLALFAFVLSAWIFPHQRAALIFTEAEAVTLFAAPLARRTLIHFKLLKAQAGILLTTLVFSFLGRRLGAQGEAWIHLGGWWAILSLLNLHFLGASFARTQLLDRGITSRTRRGIILGALALVLAAVVIWARDTLRPPAETDLADLKAIGRYVGELLEAGPVPWLLLPFRLVLRPYLATDLPGFLEAIWPVLLLLAVHYVWVVRSNVAFEEASLALAQKRAQLISAARQGQLTTAQRKARRAPFVLAPTGPPAVALLWKNLIAAGNLFNPRMAFLLVIALGIPAVMLGFNARRGGLAAAVGGVLLMFFIWSILLGPQLLRQDFRSDLKSIDLLKLYPLPGWRVVVGELLAPVVVLTLIQWLLLFLGVLVLGHVPGGPAIPLGHRLAIGLGAALIAPSLNALSLIIPNAAVLLFPAWFQSGQDATQGIEATGQRLIFALGQLLVFGASLIPATLVFLLVFLPIQYAVHWAPAVPVAALAASAILLTEAGLGVAWLGRVFEKFDLSSEPQS